MEDPCCNSDLKKRTARTLKWNTVDRLCSQVLYGVVGIVLANTVSKNDFGLMGVILVFQAFATIFVDSGFGTALLQKKNPDETDYSTVFWFNLVVSVAIYGILWCVAPGIASLFHHADELVPMARLSFLSFIFTGLGIVQANLLMKKMNMRRVAVANIVSQSVGGVVAIILAVRGFGAWALVWQGVCQSIIKSAWLWVFGTWRPKSIFSFIALRTIARVGGNMFGASFLSTACNNFYSFIIGIFYPLAALGVYTQADKWSKMGQGSLSQIFTSTFVPLFSGIQDDAPRFRHILGKANRLAAFVSFPFLGGLIVMAAPLFHFLFGDKWDAAIPLFQILCGRGILVVLSILYSNYILALGYARSLFWAEGIKDVLMIGAVFVALPFGSVEALVWGLFISSVLSWGVMLAIAVKYTRYPLLRYFTDIAPYCLLTVGVGGAVYTLSMFVHSPGLLLLAEGAAGIILYAAVLYAAGATTIRETMGYIFSKFRKTPVL